MSAMPLSIQDIAKEYNDSSDIAYLYNLETFLISLCYGPVLILSIMALTRLRRGSQSPPSFKWLSFIILVQTVFVTFRFVCQIGENIAECKHARFIINTDNEVEKILPKTVATSRIWMSTIGDFSARVVEALANGVLAWRAWSLYSGVLRIKYFLIIAWLCDLAAGMVYFGVYAWRTFTSMGPTPAHHIWLAYVVMYSSRWTSFALNLIATLLIGYRTWRLREMLNDAGGTLSRSSAYTILARLVETGVILLGVQLLVAVLAVAYTSGDPAEPGFIALTVIDTAFMVINVHPAGMALVGHNMWSREQHGFRDTEANGRTMSIAFQPASVSVTKLSLDSPGS
ncbi:hypothetical protein DL96DRAFT_1625857 [Flagelloscypha sp. PMI_526]|nr:hypothetical protein DL96DRAFT_1625857 [Flagelloscypha sp. PMI_526]